MTLKLYVGNLSDDTTEAQVREMFAQVGEVTSVALITDRDTGRGRGFGFVEMSSTEHGQEAIKRFNGYALNNNMLLVNEARPREERSGRYAGNTGGGREDRPFSNRPQNNGGGKRNRF